MNLLELKKMEELEKASGEEKKKLNKDDFAEQDDVPSLSMSVAKKEDLKKEHMSFEEMVAHLKSQGHSEESARKIAASIGRAKYGAKGMAERASAGMHKSEVEGRSYNQLKKEELEKGASQKGGSREKDYNQGVHRDIGERGQSWAGSLNQKAKRIAWEHGPGTGSTAIERAKEQHKKVLGEIKSIKPNFPSFGKSEVEGRSYNQLKKEELEKAIPKQPKPIAAIKHPKPIKAKSSMDAMPGKSDQMKMNKSEVIERAREVLRQLKNRK